MAWTKSRTLWKVNSSPMTARQPLVPNRIMAAPPPGRAFFLSWPSMGTKRTWASCSMTGLPLTFVTRFSDWYSSVSSSGMTSRPPSLSCWTSGRRDLAGRAGDHDGVEGRLLDPAEIAVVALDLDVGVAQRGQRLPRPCGSGPR